MPFRFIHTADIHMDSPLRSLAMRNADLAELVGDATRQALIAIVDLCIDEQVDALIIAGDLYDGDQTSMKTARFLASQMQRLNEAGIATFIIRGNHDAMSRITQELILPPSVTRFGGRADAINLNRGDLDLSIHGLSFAKPQAPIQRHSPCGQAARSDRPAFLQHLLVHQAALPGQMWLWWSW